MTSSYHPNTGLRIRMDPYGQITKNIPNVISTTFYQKSSVADIPQDTLTGYTCAVMINNVKPKKYTVSLASFTLVNNSIKLNQTFKAVSYLCYRQDNTIK